VTPLPRQTSHETIFAMRHLGPSIRLLSRSPGFFALALLTMALGVGAAMALIAVVDTAFLRPLPYPGDERIVVFQPVVLSSGKVVGMLPDPMVEAIRQHQGLELLSYIESADLTPILNDAAETWKGVAISPHVAALFGIRVVLGNGFGPDDYRSGGPDVILISRALWQSRFGGDPGVIGRAVPCDGRTVRIVGVVETLRLPVFPGAMVPQFLMPDRTPEAELRAQGMLAPFARMRDGVTTAHVQAEMSTRLGAIASQQPYWFNIAAMKMSRLRDYLFRGQRLTFHLLSWAALGTILIIAVNLSNLVLARQRFRRRELAVHAALGASRASLLVRLGIENLLIAIAATPLAILVARIVCLQLRDHVTPELSQTFLPIVDARTAVITGLLALALAIAITLIAARETWRGACPIALLPRLHSGTTRRHAGRRMLVAIQSGVVLILLAAAGLMISSVIRLERLDVGSDVTDVFVLTPRLPREGYDALKSLSFWRELRERLEAEPTTVAAALGFSLPMEQRGAWAALRGRDGVDPANRGEMVPVSRSYFDTLRIPLRQGRTFTRQEDLDGTQVGVVNESAARRFWPNVSAIGQSFQSPFFAQPFRIIGVAADTRFSPELATVPTIYVPIWHERPMALRLIVKSHQDKAALSRWLALQARALEPAAVTPPSQSYQELLAKSYVRPAFFATILTVFASLTLVIAAVGTAAVVGYSVVLRYRELGIRLALGASQFAIHRMVMAEAVIPAIAGIFAGLAGTFAFARLLRQEIFEARTFDLLAYAGAALVLTIVIAFAAYVPARWASAVDPSITLRNE
jgi:predicted permease